MRIAAILLLVVSAFPPPLSAARARLATRAWSSPRCGVTSFAGVAVSTDGGATTLKRAVELEELAYTYGVAALEPANQLFAVHYSSGFGRLLRSLDAGCTWTELGALDGASTFTILDAAPGGGAWAWTLNDRYLWRIDPSAVTPLAIPENEIAGLGIDRSEAARIRLAATNGAIWESRDRGATWTWLSTLKLDAPLLYSVAFDSTNLDHVLMGVVKTGVHVTFDGGRTWARATGLSASGRGAVNAMRVAISPVDPNVVWAMGIDMEQSDAQHPSLGRHIYLSEDGGMTFRPVVDRSTAVTIVNGPVMKAHPADRLRVLWIFGTYYEGYGTDVFDYDGGAQRLRVHHHPFDDVNAISFSPADPDVVYFGLEEERIRVD